MAEEFSDDVAVGFATYWNKPVDKPEAHPWCEHLMDLHCKAELFGSRLEASVERCVRYASEKKRNGMGLSTYRRTTEYKALVLQSAGLKSHCHCDAELAAIIIGKRPKLKTVWTVDTRRRYLLIADRTNTESTIICSCGR